MNKILFSRASLLFVAAPLFLFGCGGSSSPARDGAADGAQETVADGAADDASTPADSAGFASDALAPGDGAVSGDASGDRAPTADGGAGASGDGSAGDTTTSDGAVTASDGAITTSDALAPDAAAVTPDALAPDAAVVTPDALAPDAPAATPDSAVVELDAAVSADATAAADTTESDSSPLGFPDAIVCQGACTCPAADPASLFVDPVAGSDVANGGTTPTGASSPSSCRFKTIAKALMASTPATKTIVVGSAVAPIVLSGEVFPMVIPAGVTVTTADATAAHYILPVSGGSTAASLSLGNGSSLIGFTITVSGALTDAKAVSCPSGAVTLRGVTLTGANNMGSGILVGETARCTATLEDVTVTGFSTGVLVSAGGLVATRLAADGNAQYGLHVRDGDITNVTINAGSHFNSNMVDGLRTDRGTLVATGFVATKNKGVGVNVRGGTVTLHQASLNANGDLGLLTIGAKTTIDDGSQMNDNGASGARTEGGTLIVGGATGAIVDLSRNGVENALYGVNIDAPGTGTEVVITRAVMTANYGYGIKVLFQSPGGSVKVSDTELVQNRLGGIVVRAAEPTAAVPSPLVAERMNIHDNGSGGQTGFGVNLLSNDHGTASTIRNSVIKDNGDVGVWAEQPAGHITWAALEGNDIDGNNTTAGRAVGGVYFSAPATLASFAGNQIHDNKGDEVGFAAAPNGGGAWVLHAATGCADAAAINQISCYGTGNVGLRTSGAAAVMVDAQNVSWQNAAPAAAVDYVAGVGSVNAAGACAVATTACR